MLENKKGIFNRFFSKPSSSRILSVLKLLKAGFRESVSGLMYPHADSAVHRGPSSHACGAFVLDTGARSRTIFASDMVQSGFRTNRDSEISNAITGCDQNFSIAVSGCV